MFSAVLLDLPTRRKVENRATFCTPLTREGERERDAAGGCSRASNEQLSRGPHLAGLDVGVAAAEIAPLESQEQDGDHQPLQHISSFELQLCLMPDTLVDLYGYIALGRHFPQVFLANDGGALQRHGHWN